MPKISTVRQRCVYVAALALWASAIVPTFAQTEPSAGSVGTARADASAGISDTHPVDPHPVDPHPVDLHPVDPHLVDPHPVLAEHDHWVLIFLLIVLFGFFIPAGIIGPLSRYLAAEEIPELHTRDETDAHAATQHEPGHTGSA